MDQTNFENINQRVKLGVHYLDHNPDAQQGWMPYFSGSVLRQAHYEHHEWDACDVGWRMIEAYLLARRVLGQPSPGEAEQKLRAFVLGTIRDDGLSYRPDRPWCRPHAWMWDHGRALIALATWLTLEPSEQVAAVARKMVEGLAHIAIRDGENWTFPAENWTGSEWGNTVYAHPPGGLAIEGMVDLARLLRDDRILDIAGHFVRTVRAWDPPMFDAQGRLVPMGGGPYTFWFTHLHSRLGITLGLIKYALATGDRELLEWGVRIYRTTQVELCSPSGWTPEGPEVAEGLGATGRGEGCGVSDVVQIAACLANHGYPEERATVGIYGVNEVFAHQYVDFSPLEHLIDRTGSPPDNDRRSYRDMPERCLGACQGNMHVNDLVLDLSAQGGPTQEADPSGCCSPACIKAMCLVWNEALQRHNGELRVNLWVSMENDDARMTCGEPYTGELRLQLKQPCDRLTVAVPGYVDASAVRADRACQLHSQTLHFNSLDVGEAVRLTYPLPLRRQTAHVSGGEYLFVWRGGRVVDILPHGPVLPPYWWRREAVQSVTADVR